jgi:NAD(P)H-flavin reductase
VTLTPPSSFADAYRSPGQYIQVRTDSGSGYFVLAGECHAPSWEILVRNNGEASIDLIGAPEGTVIGATTALGKGFPLQRARGRGLVIAVVGSALSVARPLMRDRVAHREAPLTSIFVGVRSSREIPLVDEVAGWAHAGARLVLCLSRHPDDDPSILPEAARAQGYVQAVVQTEIEAGRLGSQTDGHVVFSAGPAGMLEAMRGLANATLEVVTNV